MHHYASLVPLPAFMTKQNLASGRLLVDVDVLSAQVDHDTLIVAFPSRAPDCLDQGKPEFDQCFRDTLLVLGDDDHTGAPIRAFVVGMLAPERVVAVARQEAIDLKSWQVLINREQDRQRRHWAALAC
jgi:hypothetical protein